MVILVYTLAFFSVIYCISIIILFITELAGKKKLPWAIVMIEFGCIGLFLLLIALILNHKIDFVGGNSEEDDWGAGLANVMSVSFNLFILISIFILTQFFIGAIFSKEFKKLNKKD